MARNPTGKPPRAKRTAARTKYTTNGTANNHKPKEKPLILRRNSTGRRNSTDSRGSNDSRGSRGSNCSKNSVDRRVSKVSLKTIPGFCPVLGRDTSTPREDMLFIKAVADATNHYAEKKKSPGGSMIFVQEADEIERTSSDSEDGKDNYPSVCRRCYVNFSTTVSPLCCHRFCDDCYNKCIKDPIAFLDGRYDDGVFICFACAKIESESRGSRASRASYASFQRSLPILEHCPKEVEKVYAFGSYAFINPQRCAVSSDGQTIVVVDSGCGKILLLNTGGELHQFSYLKNYHFQGGLCLLSDDTILISLQNDKYTSTSFYSLAGNFKYSAFLDHGSQVPHIVVTSENEIIALDSVSNTLDIINEEKRVHRQKFLEENEVLNPLAIAIHPVTNQVYIYDGNNNSVSVFDNKYNFTCKISLANSPTDEEKADIVSMEKTMKLLIDSDGILFRVTKVRVVAYSLEGHYIYDVVFYETNPTFNQAGMCPFKPCIRDACLAGTGKVAILMVGGAHTGEIKMYEYQIPSKYKTKFKPRIKNTNSMKAENSKKCCVIS